MGDTERSGGTDSYRAPLSRSCGEGGYGAEVVDRQRTRGDDDIPGIAASAHIRRGHDARSRSLDGQATGDVDGYVAGVADARRCGTHGTDGAVEDHTINDAQSAGVDNDASRVSAAARLHTRGNAGQELSGIARSVDIQQAGDINCD